MIDLPDFPAKKVVALRDLDREIQAGSVDAPLIGIINNCNKLPDVFTVQCCYGHFIPPGCADEHNLVTLSELPGVISVRYRLAYVTVCIRNSESGRAFYRDFSKMPAIDPLNIQFGSADWFWERSVNTYAVQVEPIRFMELDQVEIGMAEALLIESARDKLFNEITRVIREHRQPETAGGDGR